MIISKTPLRISLFGGGTDFPEFFKKRKSVIIGGSIDKYVYVSLSDFFSNISDENIRLFYKKREFVNVENGIAFFSNKLQLHRRSNNPISPC